jgi:hypothetical protein
MANNRRLMTDADFQEAMDLHRVIRVFQDDLIVSTGGTIIRFDDETVVIQSGVSDIHYHPRVRCEFFEQRRR